MSYRVQYLALKVGRPPVALDREAAVLVCRANLGGTAHENVEPNGFCLGPSLWQLAFEIVVGHLETRLAVSLMKVGVEGGQDAYRHIHDRILHVHVHKLYYVKKLVLLPEMIAGARLEAVFDGIVQKRGPFVTLNLLALS